MQLLKLIICLLLPISSFADQYTIQQFPGKIKVLVDIEPNVIGGEHDILFVIDNSGSMSQHQKKLSRQSKHLLSDLMAKNIDFHIGVITSDMHNPAHSGHLYGQIPFVTPTTPNIEYVLIQNLNVGTDGHWQEKFFDPVVAALSEPLLSTHNAGFFRNSATLTLIFITDTEDSGYTNEYSLVDFLTHLKGDLKYISTHAVVIPSDNPGSCIRDSEWPALRIENFISLTKGHLYDLCSEQSLQDVWKNIVNFADLNAQPGQPRVHNIPLPMIPAFDSMIVQYGTQTLIKGELKRGWVYNHALNEVILGTEIEWSLQPKGTLLEVTFVPEEWQN